MRYHTASCNSVVVRLETGSNPISEVSAFKVAHHIFALMDKTRGSSSYADFLSEHCCDSIRLPSSLSMNRFFLNWIDAVCKYGVTFNREEVALLYRVLLWLDGVARKESGYENTLSLVNLSLGSTLVLLGRTWALRDPSRPVMADDNASTKRDYYKRLYARMQSQWTDHTRAIDKLRLTRALAALVVPPCSDKA